MPITMNDIIENVTWHKQNYGAVVYLNHDAK